jgi:hypothetical protein
MKIIIKKDGSNAYLEEWQNERGLEPDKLSEHLWVSEVVDRDEPDRLIISEVLIDYFEILRTAYGKPLRINSGYRTPEHQKRLVENPDYSAAVISPHCRGYALDIDTTSISMTHSLINIIKDSKELDFYRIGWKQYLDRGQTFIHFDIAPWYHGVGRNHFGDDVPASWRITGKEW